MTTTANSVWKPWQPSSSDPWNVRRVVHLHRRAGFAATWDEIQRDLSEGHEAAVDRVLSGGSRAAGVPDDFDAMADAIGESAVNSGNINRLKAWWVYRMLFSPDPLQERLTLMWHNHFATSNLKVRNIAWMRQQNEILRTHSRARFADLLRPVIKSPAMLVWLDANKNRRESPNENLARELMELFTIGVGHFDENDVKESARALTGWSIKDDQFRFVAAGHDDSEKTILGRTGTYDGDQLLTRLLDQEATAKRVAFRVCELLMGEKAVSDNAIDGLARGLRGADLDVSWCVETVLRSQAFFSSGNIGNRVLAPIESIVGAIRSLEMSDPPPSTLLLAEWASRLGQSLFHPPNVFGWPGGRAWLSSRAVIGRMNFAASLVRGQAHNPAHPFDESAFAKRHGVPPSEHGAFFGELLLGRAVASDKTAHEILASPAAQLG